MYDFSILYVVRFKIKPLLVITLSHCSKFNKILRSFQIYKKDFSIPKSILSIGPCPPGRVRRVFTDLKVELLLWPKDKSISRGKAMDFFMLWCPLIQINRVVIFSNVDIIFLRALKNLSPESSFFKYYFQIHQYTVVV